MSPSLSRFWEERDEEWGNFYTYNIEVSKNGIYLCSFKNGFDSLKKGRNK